MKEEQFEKFQTLLARVQSDSPFYQRKFAKEQICLQDIRSVEDISGLPFTSKEELREAYPLQLQAVSEEAVIRIHSTTGTTGQPVMIPYTARDIDDWSEMMKRCMEIAGVTNRDRVQVTPGYGLWTAGLGFQAGAEKLGAMVIPIGPGNTERQLQMMLDLQSTVLVATSSYGLLLAEEIHRRGVRERLHLKKAILGSERWGEKMRTRIREELAVELYDIYGLTEVYGPGISVSCRCDSGLHYWDDYFYFEVIDAQIGRNVADGKWGELVITTLTKQGAPLIRYRTRDLTRLIPGVCACGLAYPRHAPILGRTDDMIKIKGVNIYPGQIEDALQSLAGVSSEYQIVVERNANAKDTLLLRFEISEGTDAAAAAAQVRQSVKNRIGIRIEAQALALGALPRSEKKTARVIDQRD